MTKHRIAFIGAWIVLIFALLAFPGFEAQGIAMGLVIGWWPFLLLGPLVGDSQNGEAIAYLTVFILSGTTVGFCAWVMDRASLTKKVWIVLLFSIMVGAAVINALHDYDFEDWRNSAAVSAAMNSPEVNYEPTRRDFYEDIVIPGTLAGGMWGLYVATAASLLCAITTILLRRRTLKGQKLASG